MPAKTATNPSLTTRRGEASGRSFGMPTANSSSISDRGSSRIPVSTADSPSATDRNSGMVKKTPACTRNMNRNEPTPLRSRRTHPESELTAAFSSSPSARAHLLNRKTAAPLMALQGSDGYRAAGVLRSFALALGT
ncbi:hypothetical protein QRX50_37195 [Amycolatopsis carbonis]|uniref:Uncharacterized protein n=1 Tax=Amycolatopsis carbonis TaxID=715471 RepID=A0A9Y2MVR5_9PSEU|nr:hypothetical protein [Amycolatopsis sp. 2-15]WIX77007.1 hypothetical protein QRX50_37195 [Amycolatopsis sp. 2-15]